MWKWNRPRCSHPDLWIQNPWSPQSPSSKLTSAVELELSGGAKDISVCGPPTSCHVLLHVWLAVCSHPASPGHPGSNTGSPAFAFISLSYLIVFQTTPFLLRLTIFLCLEFRIVTGREFSFALSLLSCSNYSTIAILMFLSPKSYDKKLLNKILGLCTVYWWLISSFVIVSSDSMVWVTSTFRKLGILLWPHMINFCKCSTV